MVRKISGLFEKCFQMSEKKNIIRLSHLPFEDGYYVTEDDIVLCVKKDEFSVYVLTNDDWEKGQHFYSLWYDDMTDFADIPDVLMKEFIIPEFTFKKREEE